MDICARVDMNVGISFVRLSIVNANECVRIVSGQHMARNTRATQTPGRERFFLQGGVRVARCSCLGCSRAERVRGRVLWLQHVRRVCEARTGRAWAACKALWRAKQARGWSRVGSAASGHGLRQPRATGYG